MLSNNKWWRWYWSVCVCLLRALHG